MKKTLSIILSIVFVFALPLQTFALIDEAYTYTLEDGTIINYYLDEDGLPYIIENGEEVYIGLPLPQFEIKDEKVLDELNMEIQNINDDKVVRTTPTNYFELTVDSDLPTQSIAYSNRYSFTNHTINYTPVFKMNGNHKTIRFRTDNVEKPLLGSKKVSFIIQIYSTTEKKWYAYTYTDQLCTGSTGFGFGYLSPFNYAKYTLLIPDDVTAYTAVVWTTYD